MKPFENPEAVAEAGAEAFIRQCREAIAARGRFVVALAGGSTPKLMYGMLARRANEVDWRHVWVLFGDDRYVPAKDANSNEGLARETLLDHVPIPVANVIGMYRTGGPEFAALAYEEALIKLTANDRIDLVYLGLGADGHTLSLFPGSPAVREDLRWVVAAEAPVGVRDRITMTRIPVLKARQVILMACGSDKADALARCVSGPLDEDTTPSQAIVRHREVELLVDHAAAATLDS